MGPEVVLASVGDMLNHDNEIYNCKWSYEDGCYKIKTVKPIAKGEAMIYSYAKSINNTKSLFGFGFS